MRILQVIHYLSPLHGGGSINVAYNLSKHLAGRGHEVTIFTTDFELDNGYIQSLDGVRVVPFHCIANIGLMLISPEMKEQLKKKIKNFDVIHMHNFRSYQNIIAHHYAKKYGVPYVVEPYGSILRMKRKPRLKTLFDIFFGYRLTRDAYKVIAATEMEMDEEKSMGVNDEKIDLILPGYDVNSFSDLPDFGQFREKFGIKEENIILFLARIHEIKGVAFLVKAFAELTHSKNDIILVIAGPDDGYKSTIEKLIDELNISSKILFTGFLDGDEKLSAYVDATMFVQPSKYERFCGSPFEAILCNTPIIVTKNTGCGNFVNKMDMGYTVNYGDVNELRNTMEEILSDLPEAHVKTQRGKQYIISNLTWEKQIEKYEKLYQNAIEGVK